jgi:hypothetical protein
MSERHDTGHSLWQLLADRSAEWIGGQLTDHDAPDATTRIAGIAFDGRRLSIIGDDFTWACDRQYLVVAPARGGDGLELSGLSGVFACTIRKPTTPLGGSDGSDCEV